MRKKLQAGPRFLRSFPFPFGVASGELRAMFDAVPDRDAVVLDLDLKVMSTVLFYGRSPDPRLATALEATRDAIVALPSAERELYKVVIEPFVEALEAFTSQVTISHPKKVTASGLPRLVPLSGRTPGFASLGQVLRTLVVRVIDRHLSGAAAVKAYRLAMRDYLGRELESEATDERGDAAREMRRARKSPDGFTIVFR